MFVHETRFRLTSASRGPSATAKLPVLVAAKLLEFIDKIRTRDWRVCVQALTAEVNMQSSKGAEDKDEITLLRTEINDWKRKYYESRRKVATVAQ